MQLANCSWYLKESFINLLEQLFGKSDAGFGMSAIFLLFLRHYYILFCFTVNRNFIYLQGRPYTSGRNIVSFRSFVQR